MGGDNWQQPSSTYKGSRSHSHDTLQRGQGLVLAVNGKTSMWEAIQLTDKDPKGHVVGFKVCLTMHSSKA